MRGELTEVVPESDKAAPFGCGVSFIGIESEKRGGEFCGEVGDFVDVSVLCFRGRAGSAVSGTGSGVERLPLVGGHQCPVGCGEGVGVVGHEWVAFVGGCGLSGFTRYSRGSDNDGGLVSVE